MRYLILILTHLFIFALFFRIKVFPFKEQLDTKHRGWFETIDKIVSPITNLLGGKSKPYQLGPHLSWNVGEAVLLIILLAISFAVAAAL